MRTLLTACRGLSCPQERVTGDLVPELTAEYSRQYILRFIERHRAELNRHDAGLSSFLRGWLAPQRSFDDFWDPAVAEARLEVLRTRPRRPVHVAAALALRLSARGEAGAWGVELPAPARLHWGRWVLPRAESVRVTSSGRRALVQTRRGRARAEHTFVRAGGDWKSTVTQSLPHVTSRTQPILLLLGDAVSTLPDADEVPRPSRQTANAIVRATSNAFTLLSRHAPAYVPWVDRVIRGVVPVHSTLSTIRSGSDFNHPGVIHMSFPARTFALAEMFVHESSHQYFQMASRLGDLHDSSDRTLYYSPVRRMGRPIDRILLAYHAFANVLLFYRDYAVRGRTHLASCRRHEANLVPQLEQLEAALRTSPALTPLGHALWRPVARRIH